MHPVVNVNERTLQAEKPFRILLVDDDWVTLRLMTFGLERFGYEIECAGDGEEAWRLFGQSAPDLLLTDVQMPRLDGLGLVRRVRSNPDLARLPIILSTHKAFELSEELRRDLGIAGVLPKPFNPRICAQAIRNALHAERDGSNSHL